MQSATSQCCRCLNSLVAQRLKRLPAMQETWVWSLGWEDLLEKEIATHSSILAWRIPWTEEPSGLQSTGSQRVRHNWATSLSLWGVNECRLKRAADTSVCSSPICHPGDCPSSLLGSHQVNCHNLSPSEWSGQLIQVAERGIRHSLTRRSHLPLCKQFVQRMQEDLVLSLGCFLSHLV